ncbi:MAG TPA: hypothetical protein PLI21_00860 [Methanomassiliicoccaceae archaeon]|nr:hypothetical protein [Methanomassiliicoccaceae archaeon]
MRVELEEIVVPELEESTSNYRMWTEREIAILRKYYGKADTRRIAEVLNRSKNAVQSKAVELGLTFRRGGNDER